MRRWIWATCALALVSSGCRQTTAARLDIATTTSVQNSGLLDALLPTYQSEAGIQVRVHAAGSGRALQMLEDGLAQLVISHAPEAEAAALQKHPDWTRERLAHNWFIIVGPASDPAGVRHSTDAADVFRRLSRAEAPFVTRGDGSGTHERELSLWKAAGENAQAERYITSGRGMAVALRHADELQAYTLSDEATFLQLAPELDLEMLYGGDERLRNVYSVIHPPKDDTAAAFSEWLVRGNGRALIARFTIAGRQVFEVEDP